MNEAKRGASSRSISISPPPKRRQVSGKSETGPGNDALKASPEAPEIPLRETSQEVPSPVQLNFIDQFPAEANVDTVSLGSILGDVMIRECWLFNYLFDVEFIMYVRFQGP